MAEAKKGDRARVHYTGAFKDGTVFDSSLTDKPFEFTVGRGEVIEAFDKAVIGMQPGETRKITVSPEQGYGPRRQNLLIEIKRSDLPPGFKPHVNKRLRINGPGGKSFDVVIVAVTDTGLTVDANHPLAGKDLLFEIKLLELVSGNKKEK